MDPITRNTKMRVTNLPPEVSAQDLEDYLAQYGDVVKVTMSNNNTAVVEYEDPDDIKYAISIGEIIIRGRKVYLEKYYGTIAEIKIRDALNANIEKWNTLLKKFLNNVTASKVVFCNTFFPDEFMPNGSKFDIYLTMEYENLLSDNLVKLLYNPDDYEKEMKILLNQYNDFGYYNINVLRMKMESVCMYPHSKNTKFRIKIAGELIHPNDYYSTIGAYRIAWKNICEEENFSKKELVKIANDLNLNYNSTDNLCHIIGEKVNDLKWDDFNED
jgi:hypothetical protein